MAVAPALADETRAVLQDMLRAQDEPSQALSLLQDGGFYDGAAADGPEASAVMVALAEECGHSGVGGATWDGMAQAIATSRVPAFPDLPVVVEVGVAGPRPWDCLPGLRLTDDATVSGSVLGVVRDVTEFVLPTVREGSDGITWVRATPSQYERVAANEPSVALARFQFANATSEVVGVGSAGVELWRALGERLPLFVAAELLGLGRAALDKTLQHATTRTTFGRPIGSRQAVKHRCAEMFAQVEALSSLVWAASTVPSGASGRAQHLVRVAKSYASARIPALIGDAILTHGALGFSEELGLGRMWRRAVTLAACFGSANDHRRVTIAGIREGS